MSARFFSPFRDSAVTALACLAMLLFSPFLRSAPEGDQREPPNAPANLEVDRARGRFVLSYAGTVIFQGELAYRSREGERPFSDLEIPWIEKRDESGSGPAVVCETFEIQGERKSLEQQIVFSLNGADPGLSLVLRGVCRGSGESFPAETLGPAQERFPLIRNCVGLSRSLRNNAVFDRRFDWLLCGRAEGWTRIIPKEETVQGNAFTLEVRGKQCTLVFRPRYYQKHRNLPFFEPWTYSVWPASVAGWCSWWPYRAEISEAVVQEVAGVFAERLRDFGYRTIQIDDGFQSNMDGLPDGWLDTNDRFPGGLARLVEIIEAQDLEPGIWLSVRFGDEAFVKEHPGWFAADDEGKPFRGNWIAYSLDGTCPEAIDSVVRPLYRALRSQKWRYVKIDTLRHLLYDGYYPCRDFFSSKGATCEQAIRGILAAAREEIGRDTYMLACWGVLPEAIGIADGCRLGWDGFGATTLVQYNSWNNVVWRNDPDHVDITPDGEEIIRPVTVCMAGAVMMLTDKVEVYRDDKKIEGARRSAPIPFTLPGQLYDFDSSKTDNVAAGLRNEKGGASPGPIDADQQGTFCPWWLMEIDRPFARWNVLARMSWEALPEATVRFGELGLPPDREYVLYEYWSGDPARVFHRSFPVPAQKAREVRVYSIREKLDRPQIISTSRHILQGWPDLEELAWDGAGRCLHGKSRVIKGDPYTLVVRVPRKPKVFTVLRASSMGRATARSRRRGSAASPSRPTARGSSSGGSGSRRSELERFRFPCSRPTRRCVLP